MDTFARMGQLYRSGGMVLAPAPPQCMMPRLAENVFGEVLGCRESVT